MDVLDATIFIRNLWSPVHELGHVVFGWLSFNPTIIVSWGMSGSMFDTWPVSMGGTIFELMFFVFLTELSLRKFHIGWAWLYTIPLCLVVILSMGFQSDLDGRFWIYYVWLVAAIASIVYIAARSIQEAIHGRTHGTVP